MIKFVELFGNALLTGAAAWALITSKSTFHYDSLSYIFFLSIGISGLLANVANNRRVTKFTKSKSQNSLTFATALLLTEVCLVAGMDELLASFNLILPPLTMLKNHRNNEKILEIPRWYRAIIMLYTQELQIGSVLTFILPLTDPKVSKFSSYLMVTSIILAVPYLNLLKNIS